MTNGGDPWDRRLPVPRRRRRPEVFAAYGIAVALLVGAGALAVWQLRPRPATPPSTEARAGEARPPAAARTNLQMPPPVNLAMPKLPPPAAPAAAPPAPPPAAPTPPAAAAPGAEASTPPAAAAPGAEASTAVTPPSAAAPPSSIAPSSTVPPAPPAAAGGASPPTGTTPPAATAAPRTTWTVLAASGLPAPPPEKPPVPIRCPPVDLSTLVETTPQGRLPRIDAHGCMPWLAHAAVFNYRETRPRIGVLILGLGKDPALTQRAIDGLPPQITLGFMWDAPFLDRWIERARGKGHEALIVLPAQAPEGAQDGAPAASLRVDVSAAENQRRLAAALARGGTGYVGVVLPLPGPVSADDATLRPIVKTLADRGLMLVETFRTGRAVYQASRDAGLPYSADAGWVDRQPGAAELKANLEALEKFTRQNKFALAVAMARKDTVEELATWSREVEARGFALAPVTGLTECVDVCATRVEKALAVGAR
ncbi:MAG: divergent polysaccharide deacetylase family protein [Rhodospirillales bacterium]|nr:MAG: divergent polysaccharide deacetylase family protein [Rhodospirillales bacterium]